MTTAPSQRTGWSPTVQMHVHRFAQGPEALGGPLSSHLPSLPGNAFFQWKGEDNYQCSGILADYKLAKINSPANVRKPLTGDIFLQRKPEGASSNPLATGSRRRFGREPPDIHSGITRGHFHAALRGGPTRRGDRGVSREAALPPTKPPVLPREQGCL